ncbi:MAG: BACON domain-containing protein [Tannerellaceae bacterium]|nr:BACON domain-containing protein [Tannerellaceae bacterium]
MKTKKYILYAIITGMVAIQLLTVACTDSYGDWQPDENYTSPFTLSLELPRPKTAELTTRAMTEEQESQVKELTLLLFKTGAGNTEVLESTRTIPGEKLIPDGNNPRRYTTTATLDPGTYSSFVILANSETALSTPGAQALLTPGTSRSDIEEGLLFSLDDATRWNATSSPQLIPMWGMIEGGSTGIQINNTPKTYSTKLFRMLASIDLIIEQEDEDGNPLPAFKPTNIYLCNFYRNGRMIPMHTTSHYDGSKLLDTSLPADARRLTYTDPLVYESDLADPDKLPDIVIRNEIYTFEQPPSDGAEESSAPFIILKGEYEDTGYDSFYRIDFVERQHEDPADPLKAEDNFLPLIRNYTYSIVVKEILGPGYRSFEDAATCKPFNTVNEVFRFDDSDSESVQFDGKYFLSVSDETIHYNRDESTQTFVVKTDSPLGWQIGNILYSGGDGSTGWLTMDKDEGVRGGNGEVSLTAAAYNSTTSTPREASFTVTSGRMEHTIKVIQSHLQGISLEIVDEAGEPLTEIWFRSNPRKTPPQADRKFTVRWSAPNGCKMGVMMLGDRIFPFDTSEIKEGRTLIPGEEEYTFTITPRAFTEPETDPAEGNPFLQEGATITFQVDNGEETITKSIYIRHQCISIVIDNPEIYSYMGHEEKITIRSNTSWELKDVETELDGLFLVPATGADFKAMIGTPGGYNTNPGDVMTYSVQPASAEGGIYGLGRAGRKMVLTFRDTEGFAPDETTDFIATTPDPNCYMVPSGQSVSIPLRKLFWVWEREVERDNPLDPLGNLNLDPVLIWQTPSGLIQPPTIRNNSSDYRDATLEITAGTVNYGNAVVGVQIGNEILWSFHIWVTGYNPDTGGPVFAYPKNVVYMDRNLGSNGVYIREELPTPESAGLYYQWGRKDPFPGPIDFTTDNLDLHIHENQYPIYDGTNQRTYITYENIPAGTDKNLGNSINYPAWFFTCEGETSPMEDWYTTQTENKYQNDYLWNDTHKRKTVFDPCPAGWRVSSGSEMESFWPKEYYLQGHAYEYVEEYLPTFTLKTGETFIFPAGGYIVDGQTDQVGKGDPYNPNEKEKFVTSANIWDRETYIHNAAAEGFSLEILAYFASDRKHGFNVRCVKDLYDWWKQ